MQVIKDPYGNEYPTLKAMCDAYSVTTTLYDKRKSRGWSEKECLEGHKVIYEKDGIKFRSYSSLCKHYKIHPNTFYKKLANGYSIDDILARKTYRVEDFNGIKYYSNKEMCDVYGISVATYRSRRTAGMSLKDALSYKPKTIYHWSKTHKPD